MASIAFSFPFFGIWCLQRTLSNSFWSLELNSWPFIFGIGSWITWEVYLTQNMLHKICITVKKFYYINSLILVKNHHKSPLFVVQYLIVRLYRLSWNQYHSGPGTHGNVSPRPDETGRACEGPWKWGYNLRLR